QCLLISRRRQVTNKLMRLRSKTRLNVDNIDAKYTCFKCRLHGVQSVKKFHTPCPFATCRCQSCLLNDERSRINSELSRLLHKENQENRESEHSISECSHSSDSEHSEVKEVPSLSADAKVILDLLNVLAIDPTLFNPYSFDFPALADFFSRPTLLLPEEWLPEWPEIVSLVHEAL
ncbi:hypothetical protein PMAYCL1PPCAC_14056, partial [Pristionchus mayeri]